MNVFILEDDPTNERIPAFRRALQDHTLYIAKDALQGRSMLQSLLDKEIKLDFIFLDHDLGNRVFVNSTDINCGVRIAEFIRDNEIQGQVYFHTQNPVGAMNMKAVIPEGVICPFPVLIKSIRG
jgi:hypothetical protein